MFQQVSGAKECRSRETHPEDVEESPKFVKHHMGHQGLCKGNSCKNTTKLKVKIYKN